VLAVKKREAASAPPSFHEIVALVEHVERVAQELDRVGPLKGDLPAADGSGFQRC
jgi:hypothetical protein